MTTAYHKVASLDGLEVLIAHRYAQPFPWHAHDCFTLSLVTHGTEVIQLPTTTLYAPTGSLSIVHPHEVHATPLLHPTGYSFSTFYVSPALVMSLAGGPSVRFLQRVIHQPSLFTHFWRLQHLVPQAGPLFERAFVQGLRQLIACHGSEADEVEPLATGKMQALRQQLTEQLLSPPSLAQLARQQGLSKVKLVQAFKQQTGLTPQGFVLLQRIEAAKCLLRQEVH